MKNEEEIIKRIAWLKQRLKEFDKLSLGNDHYLLRMERTWARLDELNRVLKSKGDWYEE